MLSELNRIYFVFGTLFYLFIAVVFKVELPVLFAFNYFTLLVFALFINYLIKKPDSYFSHQKINFLVFYFSVFFILCNNTISYYYTGNFYIFSEDDALLYHRESEFMSQMDFIKSIQYYLSRHEVEDLGLVLVMSLLYKFFASKIMLNIFYVFVAIFTANGVYNIAKRFMPVKYACLCTATYCLSSYVIWYHSSGLKESLMILLIVVFYDCYYRVIFDQKALAVWGLMLMPLALLLFRPVLAIFCLASIALGVVLKRKLKASQLIFLFLVVLVGLYFLEPLIGSTDKFLLGGTDRMLEIKEMEGMVKGSVSFTYLVNTVSSMFGPFPSLVSSKNHLSFYAPGLIFKVFLSLTFWFGLRRIIKKNIYQTYPMLLFIAFEMISLTYILEALELRKSIPHFPMFYIISFIFIHKYDSLQLDTVKNHLFYKKAFNFFIAVLGILMVYWNFR